MCVWEIDSPCIHLLSRVMTIYIFEFEGLTLGANIPDFYEIISAPITKVCYSSQKVWQIIFAAIMTNSHFVLQILNRWFESEPLKATLATDAVIGAMTSPSNPGSG